VTYINFFRGEKIKMKEMVYSTNRKREVLATGYCFGLLYYIMNLGLYPTAYIKLPNNFNIDENEIEVHGGITYSEDHLWISENQKLDGKFVGWDYAHYGDYDGYKELVSKKFRTGGKRWTTEEIYKEVREACYQIQEIGGEKKDERKNN
jgi:hypothetical protein